MLQERQKAVVLLLCTAVLWSTGGLLIKWVDWHPMAIAGMRSATARLFCCSCCDVQRLPGQVCK